MNLFDRVVCSTPLGYSGVWFRLWNYRNQEKTSGINSFIVIVMERYASRFGVVKDEDAHNFHWRLAVKYSNNPSSTVKSLFYTNESGIYYPRKISYELNKIAILNKDRIKRVNEGMLNPVGPFCMLPYKYSSHAKCDCCGFMVNYEICDGSWRSKPVRNAIYLNQWRVCNNKRCRTIAVIFKRGRSNLPLINVLNEVTKHGGDNENKRRLEKHFIRHA